MLNRKPYPSDFYGEERSFIAPYLALMREDAPKRTHDLRSPRVAPREACSAVGEAGQG